MAEEVKAVLRRDQYEADPNLPDEIQARVDAIYRKYATPTTEVQTWKTTEDGSYHILGDSMIALERLFKSDEWPYTDEEWEFILGRHNAELKRRIELAAYVRVIVRGLRDVGLVREEQVPSALRELDSHLVDFVFNHYDLTPEIRADVEAAIEIQDKLNWYQVKWLDDELAEQIHRAGYEALGIREISGIELIDPKL